MTAAGSRPSRAGRVAAPDCLTHMCHHVHAAGQRDLYLALLQTSDRQLWNAGYCGQGWVGRAQIDRIWLRCWKAADTRVLPLSVSLSPARSIPAG